MKNIFKNCIDDLNIKKQSQELGIPIWQTPNLLFLLMGIIIITVITAIYFIYRKYDSPEFIIISESLIVIILMTIGNFIIHDIEQIAKVNKMKSDFILIASHQLKTPLAEISWEIELLLSKNSKGLNKKQKELVVRVEKSNNKMTQLVNDLLDVVRIEQGNLPLIREKTDISKLVDQIIQNNQIIAQANNVQIQIDKPKNLPLVFIDRRRIGVVLNNLIFNAIKYIIKKGEINISVKNNKEDLVFSIKDSGIGIPKDQQSKIFQKFFRSSNISRYQVSGTGLGLYIAKNIIEQSGGRIWFDSKEGSGSTFYFSLPIG